MSTTGSFVEVSSQGTQGSEASWDECGTSDDEWDHCSQVSELTAASEHAAAQPSSRAGGYVGVADLADLDDFEQMSLPAEVG